MCFVTFAILGHVDMHIGTTHGQPFMLGAWGTISVLAFGAMDAPVLRYWNVIVATLSASFVVVALIKCFGAVWWVRSLAIASCVALMMMTGSVHPPAAGAVGRCTLNSADPPTPRMIGWNMCRPMRRLNDACVGQ
jgi:CBS-domain-containing membrane protein